MLQMLGRFAAGVIVGVIAMLGLHISDVRKVDAIHVLTQSHLLADLHGGGRDLNYTVCTSDPATTAQWSAGAENWKQVMVEQVDFDRTFAECSGTTSTRIVMMWEYIGNLDCDGDRACFVYVEGSPNLQHSSDGPFHWHINKSFVIFNEAQYQALPSDGWRDSTSTHEFGHVFGLDHHPLLSRCNIPWIMAYPPLSPPPNVCVTTPHIDEVCPAWNHYNYDGNADANFIELGPSKAYDDLTMVHSDNAEDGCDGDADNDYLSNAEEQYLPCPSASGPTNPRVRDTDGDRVIDGAECFYGSDPASAASVPGVGGTDSDNDLLHNGLEALWGSNPNNPGTDGDGVLDGVEYRYYGSFPVLFNTDGDACHDGKEVAPINADQTVNIVDLQQIGQHASKLRSSALHREL